MPALIFWECTEYASTAVVIIGVAGEYFAEFVLEDQAAKARKVGKLSTLVLIVGLVFELISLANTNIISEEEIERLNTGSAWADAKIAEVNEGAQFAGKQAADANERAGKANERAASAGKQAAGAEIKSGEANERAAALELDAGVQREKAAIAERALLELQQRMQSRHLTTEQRKALGEQLASRPKGAVDVLCSVGSAESCAFADELAAVLGQNGWTAPNLAAASAGPVFPGVRIVVQAAAMPRAATLQAALKAAGITAPAILQPSARVDFLMIEVGVKP
jgi:hypothetical protein